MTGPHATPALAMMLISIERELRTLRAEVTALDLTPRESAWFLDALMVIECRAAGLKTSLLELQQSH